MKDTQFTHQEIKWSTTTEYIDVDTGEIIAKKEAEENYIIIKTKKQSHVYRQSGTTKVTKLIRRTTQAKLF